MKYLEVAGQAPAVLENLGQPVSADGPDAEAREIAANLRALRIRSAARAAQLSRTPGLMGALSLAAPALQNFVREQNQMGATNALS